MEIQDCITEKTANLVEHLQNAGYQIQLAIEPDLLKRNDNCWGMKPVPTFRILVPNDVVDKAAFAHELLHIDLFRQGLVNADIIRQAVDENTMVFSDETLRALNNNLAHFKMIASFLRFGFKKEEFLNEDLVENLEKCCQRVQQLSSEPDLFQKRQKFMAEYSILKFYSYAELIDSTECLNSLREIDTTLFEIMETCLKDTWLNQVGAKNIVFYKTLAERLRNL